MPRKTRAEKRHFINTVNYILSVLRSQEFEQKFTQQLVDIDLRIATLEAQLRQSRIPDGSEQITVDLSKTIYVDHIRDTHGSMKSKSSVNTAMGHPSKMESQLWSLTQRKAMLVRLSPENTATLLHSIVKQAFMKH